MLDTIKTLPLDWTTLVEVNKEYIAAMQWEWFEIFTGSKYDITDVKKPVRLGMQDWFWVIVWLNQYGVYHIRTKNGWLNLWQALFDVVKKPTKEQKKLWDILKTAFDLEIQEEGKTSDLMEKLLWVSQKIWGNGYVVKASDLPDDLRDFLLK